MSWSVQAFLSQVDNLAPDQRERVRAVFLPKGFGPVASSRNFVYIISHILRGLDPATIAVFLEREKGERIPVSAIRDYALQHIPPDLLDPHLQIIYLRNQRALDDIETMELLRKITLARLMRLLDAEGSAADDVTKAGFEESVHRTIELTRKLVETTGKLRSDGARKEAANVSEITVRPVSIFDQEDLPEADPSAKPASADGAAPATSPRPFPKRLDERQAAAALHILRELKVVPDPSKIVEAEAPPPPTPTAEAASAQ